LWSSGCRDRLIREVTDIELQPNMNREDGLSVSRLKKPPNHSQMDRKKFLSNDK
jgi:hypothetical protein